MNIARSRCLTASWCLQPSRFLKARFSTRRKEHVELPPHIGLVEQDSAHRSHLPQKPYYVTTPIFYPNAVPHIGHLYSLVIADIFARHARLSNPQQPVRFVTGTDEHGMKIQQAAKDRGMAPGELCDLLGLSFHSLAERAYIGFTKFVRTTSDEHRSGVEHLWRELDRRGFIYKGTHAGWYAVSDECFYTDAQVRKQVDPQTGSEKMVAVETGNIVEWTEEENYKFALSKFRASLLEHFGANPDSIYPPHQREVVLATLSSTGAAALQDLSISRPAARLSWGIPVPGDASQTIYVWLDALASYLTGVGYPWMDDADMVRSGWPANLQVIGKDILRFHAIYFPAFLLALDLPLPRALLSHAHWTVDRAKMSKSVGNVIDPIAEIKERGVDAVRWYLARVGGRFRDDVDPYADWSADQLVKHEAELRSLLGNFFLRIQSKKILQRVPEAFRAIPLHRGVLLGDGYLDTVIPPPGSPEYDHIAEDAVFASRDRETEYSGGVNYADEYAEYVRAQGAKVETGVVEAVAEFASDGQQVFMPELRTSLIRLRGKVAWHMQRYEVSEAVQSIVDVLNLINKEITRIQPWSPETDERAVIHLLTWSRETLRICGILLQPFTPISATALLDALHVHPGFRSYRFAEVGYGKVSAGAISWRILFPSPKYRKVLQVDADHRQDEKSKALEFADSNRRNFIRHVRKEKRTPNALYTPPFRRGRKGSGHKPHGEDPSEYAQHQTGDVSRQHAEAQRKRSRSFY